MYIIHQAVFCAFKLSHWIRDNFSLPFLIMYVNRMARMPSTGQEGASSPQRELCFVSTRPRWGTTVPLPTLPETAPGVVCHFFSYYLFYFLKCV